MIHFLVEHSSVKIGSQVIQCNSCIKVCDIEIESKHCNFEPSYLSLSQDQDQSYCNSVSFFAI